MYLECNGLVKRFGETTAVDNISFGIERGELVSLLGPSGCGKTTTLRLLAGFEAADVGDMYLDGRRLNGLPPEKRGVGVVFQHFALFPHMTVWQNIAYGLRFRRRSDRSDGEIVRELIRIVGLEGLEQRKPGQLSAGQQQRVAIARSLAPGPDLLLLDEPLSALDARLRQHLRMEIRRIQRMLGLTLLYVTHDQEEAMAISDRMIVMNAGRIEQMGEPWQVYHRPKTPFVAAFLGQTNRLRGTVERLTARAGSSLWRDGYASGSFSGEGSAGSVEAGHGGGCCSSRRTRHARSRGSEGQGAAVRSLRTVYRRSSRFAARNGVSRSYVWLYMTGP